MSNFLIAGSGTNVGKTVVAAILTTLLKGAYWKPIECGDSDTAVLQNLIHSPIYPPAYSLKAPLSPHHASRLENVTIDLNAFTLPQTNTHLIIESVGGVLVPLTRHLLSLDLFMRWECRWVIVSRHYLGSINHTLLTIEVLKSYQIPIAGIIFNGEPDPETESAILEMTDLPYLGSLLPEENITFTTIQKYAKQWQNRISHYLL